VNGQRRFCGARAFCTEGEIAGALSEVFGEYTETPRF
jgi:hypothetical protein